MVKDSSGIVKNYNNTIHKTINTTPSLASTDPSLVTVKIDLPIRMKHQNLK